MKPSDWLLLLIADADNPDVRSPLDPVRIMKGLFLLAQEGTIPRQEQYDFSAYAYGPVAFDVYADIEHLCKAGLVSGAAVPGRTWSVYAPTAEGTERARALAAGVGHRGARVREAREYLLTRSFVALLRDIYDRYPQYAVNTVMEFPPSP